MHSIILNLNAHGPSCIQYYISCHFKMVVVYIARLIQSPLQEQAYTSTEVTVNSLLCSFTYYVSQQSHTNCVSKIQQIFEPLPPVRHQVYTHPLCRDYARVISFLNSIFSKPRKTDKIGGRPHQEPITPLNMICESYSGSANIRPANLRPIFIGILRGL